MGKQVKGWVPPVEDEIIEEQTAEWIPPADDEIIDPVKKKEPARATASVGDNASAEHGKPSEKSTAKPTPTTRLQQNVDNFVTASKTRFTEEAEQKRSEFQKIVDADPTKVDSVTAEYQKFLSDREKAYNEDLDKQIEVLSEQFRKETSKPTSTPEIIKEIVSSTSGPIGSMVYDFGRRIWSGFADDIPKSLVQGLEVAKSSVSPLNVQEYIRNNKPVDFQRYVREKENIPWYQSFGPEGFDKYLGKYAEQFMQDKGLQDVAKKIKANEPKVIERRLRTEKLVQQQKIESTEKMGGAVQSFKDIKNLDDLASYIGTLGGQAAYQIPLSVLSRGSSSLLQESATVYDQQLDNLAADHGITREEVIKRGLDKPAEGQAYAVLAAALDRLSAGNIISAFKQGGGSIAKKWAKTAIPEAITEPTQGVLEDVGSATGSKSEALGEALTSSKRIDELAGGLVGGTPGAFATGPAKSVADVVNEEKANITNPADQISVEAAAEKIESKINQETDAPTVQPKSDSEGLSETSATPTESTVPEVEASTGGNVLPGSVEQTGDQSSDKGDVTIPGMESDEIIESQPPDATTGETQTDQTDGKVETQGGQKGQQDVLTQPTEQKQAEPQPASTVPDVQTQIDKLDPYESQGYNLTQNKAVKEQMQKMPERAKVAFDIMDFAKKVWPKDLVASMEKTPLAHIGQFFYGDANSVKEWVDMQIKGERQDIENRQKTIDSLKAKPKQTKADNDSIAMWEDSIKRAEQRINEYKKAYENEQKTKSPDGEGDEVQPVIGKGVSGTDSGSGRIDDIVPPGNERGTESPQEQQGKPPVVDAPAQQESEDGGGNAPADQAPASQGGIPTEPPISTDSVALDQSDEGKVSGIKKALVPENKIATTPLERRSTEDMLQSGKSAVDSGQINPKAIVDEIAIGNARSLQADEVSALVYYKAQLDNKSDSLNQELIDAIDSNDTDAQVRVRAQLDVLNNEVDRYHEMSLKTAYEQSLAFRLRQMLLDNEYNLASQILKYKAANNGEISPEVEAKFKELDEQLKAANLRIKALEEQQAKAAAELANSAIKADLQRQKERRLKAAQARKEKINEFFDSLKVKQDPNKLNNVFQVVGEGVYNGAIEAMRTAVLAGSDVAAAIQAGVDYINEHYRGTDFNPGDFQSEMEPKISKVVPTDDDALPAPTVDEEGRLHLPAKLIRHFAEISEDIDQLTDNIFRVVQEVYPDISRREVRDAITRYGETKNLSKDELDTKIREMKRIGRLISSLEDVQGGDRPKRSGLQRDKPTDKERRLMKEVKEAMKDLPVDNAELERQWRTALDAVKSRLKNQISDLENQIKTGEKTPKKKGIDYDAEANSLKEQRDKLRAIIQQIEGKPKMSDEQKIRMAIAGVERNIAELERRISTRDVSSNRRASTPVTPDLQALRDRRKQLSDVYKQLQDELGATEKKRLEMHKKALQTAIDRYQKRIATGDFITAKKTPVAPDAEATKLKLERDKIKREFDVLQEKVRYANRPMSEKIWDAVVDVFNLPKSFLASIDMSAPFRQGAILTVSNPKAGVRSFNEMFRQAFSEQKANEWLLRLKETDIYTVMKNAKLYLAEPTTRHTAREEQFLSNLASKLPIVGPAIKASERAYTGYLNKLRADVFANGADRLREQGITPQNNPEAYKALATFINNATGRGNLGGAETAAPILNALLFSPRYLASRINLLNPVTYAKMPAPVRKQALKSMAAYVGFNITILVLADAAFDDLEVEWDPRSSDFGKFRIGDTRYDPWAGFQQVVRFIAQLVTGERKSTKTGEITALDGIHFPFETRGDVALRFIRSKLSPSAATIANVLSGEDMVGNEVTLKTELAKNVIPLYLQDMKGIYEEEGPSGVVSTFIPAFFGVGVQSYGEKSKITPQVDPEGMVGALNKKHKYSITHQDRRDLSKSFEREVPTEIHEKYIQIRDEEIMRLVDKYKFRLEDITDRDIYDKSMDAIVKEAGRKAKYEIARENKWDADGFKEGNKFRLKNYVKRDGKVVERASLLR